jgi:hypothetical protein
VFIVGAVPPGFRHTASIKREIEMLHCLNLTELPERERERDSLQDTYCLSKSLVNELPSPWSPNKAAMERDALVPEPMVYSFIHISQES